MFFILFSLLISIQNNKNEIHTEYKQKNSIGTQNLLNQQKNLLNQEETNIPLPTPSPTPSDDDDDDDDDSGQINPKPQPTDQIIGRTLAGVQVTTMTYIGFVIIAAILLLFLGWKKCYKSASNNVIIKDDIVLAENNMNEPLNADNIEIRIEDLDSDDDNSQDNKEEKKDNNNENVNQQNNVSELPNPFNNPPSV